MARQWRSVEEVLDHAMGEERKAEELYRALEVQAPSEDLRALFGDLASAEAGHFEKLLGIRTAKAASFAVSDLLSRLPRPQGVTLESKGITDIASAYRYAIRAERGAARLYGTLAGLASDPEVRGTLEKLTQEELEHRQRLEADRERRRGGFLRRLFRFAASR